MEFDAQSRNGFGNAEVEPVMPLDLKQEEPATDSVNPWRNRHSQLLRELRELVADAVKL